MRISRIKRAIAALLAAIMVLGTLSPAQALFTPESWASILLYFFSSARAGQAQYNPKTMGVFSASQPLPPTVARAINLGYLATEGNLESNYVLHPIRGTTPNHENFGEITIRPFAQSLGRSYDYTKVLLNGVDVTAQLVRSSATTLKVNRDKLELDDADRIFGMVTSLSIDPNKIPPGQVWNLEFVFSMQGGEKISVHVGIQPRTLSEIYALARLKETFSAYLNAWPFGGDDRRTSMLTLQGVQLGTPVTLEVYDSLDTPGSAATIAARHVVRFNETVTIPVAPGNVRVVPDGNGVSVWALPQPVITGADGYVGYVVNGPTQVRLFTDWTKMGGN